MSKYAKEIEKRRTFAIISHPDAGKTTLTVKKKRNVNCWLLQLTFLLSNLYLFTIEPQS